ncbi:hypothetical protein LSH36_276g03042 [Paralvinella palmiformis]|uniref:G-protein coupled receptors family 1 profile domain-containing protein n=1 Tax=Paralvinella palmiformis TaxID=53620 RepID=A0AAD9N1W8_9ANNE|nr:hypothetical protein LSH36_276g03042 [Paralvinella palmiformis]
MASGNGYLDHTGSLNISSYPGQIILASLGDATNGSNALLLRYPVLPTDDENNAYVSSFSAAIGGAATIGQSDGATDADWSNPNQSWHLYNWSSSYKAAEWLLMQNGTTGGSGDLAAAIVKALFLGALVVMTICGNVLVLLAVFINAHLRSTTHYFIANLAVADLLLGTTVLPFSASLEVSDRWVFGQLFCDIWAAVDVLCCTASIMGLCVISIDRYIGVTRPLRHSTIMTERRAALIIVLVWLLSVAISVAPLLGWKEPPPDDPGTCQVTKQLGYVLFSVSGSFYIPLAIILVVYYRVYREALNQSRFLKTGVKRSRGAEADHDVTLRIHTGGTTSRSQIRNKTNAAIPSSPPSERSAECWRKTATKMTLAGKMAKFKREKKAAKTLGIVVGVFILCWFPFFFVLPLGKSASNQPMRACICLLAPRCEC